MLRAPIKRAEAAIGNADVRVIDVPVDDKCDDVVRVLIPPNAIRLGAELEERRVRVEVEEIHGVECWVRSVKREKALGGGQKRERSVRHPAGEYQTAEELGQPRQVVI